MGSDLYLDLGWLPRPPDDFSRQLRSLTPHDTDLGSALQRLAAFGLEESKLVLMARLLKAAILAETRLQPLAPLKLVIVSNATTEFLEPVLVATCIRHGFALRVLSAPYGQVIQEALDPKSSINLFAPDLALCVIDYRGLPLQLCPGDADAADAAITASVDFIEAIRAGLEKNSNAVCIFQTLARPAEALFGSLDAVVVGTWRDLTDRFNRRLAESVSGSSHLLLDTASIAETIGLSRWHDPMLWNLAKAPFANAALPLFADHIGRLISAWRGKGRRCLVLDLDNTIWGGIIGDDGIDNILIAEGDPTGEAHLDVQRIALRLRDRGVVLAVSSKNNDEVARMPFRKHAEMLLREDHFAVFQANWRDKATNIRAISEELALGLESMVFLDDNPVERGFVRETLPSVCVPELPDDPAFFARTLIASGCFETVVFSAEDRNRAADYQTNARRLALQSSVGNVEDYLRSLEMKITFKSFDAQGRARISQLINKSNQFNLTTRRYSEADVEAAEKDPETFTLQVRLADRFADNGMISVIVCRRNAKAWWIDTWLMSCRVLGRHVERAVLQALARYARQRDIDTLVGEFAPTERNSMVAQHYADLGFALSNLSKNGATTWQINVSDIIDQPLLMTVVDLVQ